MVAFHAMSQAAAAVGGELAEEVARIAGHSTTVTMQRVHRRELRPVLAEGVAAIDKLFR